MAHKVKMKFPLEENYTDAVLTVKCQAAYLHEDAVIHYYKSESRWHAEEFVRRIDELKKAIEYFERENAKRIEAHANT